MELPQHRLFPEDKCVAQHHLDNLQHIVDICRRWKSAVGGQLAGYTYWGQFIAHELAPRLPKHPVRTSWLDLGSVYGGAGVPPPIDERTGEFLLGPLKSGTNRPVDLPRDGGKRALIPEQRNDENLLVAQFHLLLLRAHNAIAFKLAENGNTDSGEEGYFRARRILLTLFHHLTIVDYLKKTTCTRVHESVFEEHRRYFVWGPHRALPLEATHAVMRFGHSQVRENYTLNLEHSPGLLELGELFRLTADGMLDSKPALPEDRCVDWRRFFSIDRAPLVQPTAGEAIDPRMTPAIDRVHRIIHRNVMAGINAALPSGQVAVRCAIDAHPGIEAEFGMNAWFSCSSFNAGLLRAARIEHETPLWIFVLIEATQAGAASNHLGPFGSLIVCEVLRNAIENARLSIELPDIVECEQLLESGFQEIRDLILFIESTEDRR